MLSNKPLAAVNLLLEGLGEDVLLQGVGDMLVFVEGTPE